MPESVKEGATGLHEGSDIGLGASGRAFESRYSDQTLQFSVGKLEGLYFFTVTYKQHLAVH